LPFFPSNADGGFLPLTHKEVDPDFGTWDDIEAFTKKYGMCVDLTVNHISDESPEFKDFIAKGFDSKYREITPDDMAKIHIRKEKEPFREVTLADSRKTRVWCTFTEQQIDLNYDSELTYQLMASYIELLTSKGVNLLRLSAFGCTTKRIGTSCFLVEPEVYHILD
jgi:glycosidase